MKIIFAGTPEFATVSLQAIINSQHEISAVYTQPDRPAGRGQKLAASAVKQLALQHSLPVFQPTSLKTEEQQEKLRSFNADVMVVAAYGLILPKTVLAIPHYGCINIHASCLPRWRGAAPVQRAILAGDTETGISIMQMDAGLDTGEVLWLGNCKIKAADTTASLLKKLAQLGGEAILETLSNLPRNNLIRSPQNSQLATYAAKIIKSEAKINWQQSALAIDRLVRAFNPWPVAYTCLNGTTLRIWQAQPIATDTHSEPGTIIDLANKGIDVVCGSGMLRLTEIQWPNAKRQHVEQSLSAQQKILKIAPKFSS